MYVLSVFSDSEPYPGLKGQQIPSPAGSDASGGCRKEPTHVWTGPRSDKQQRDDVYTKIWKEGAVFLLVLMKR